MKVENENEDTYGFSEAIKNAERARIWFPAIWAAVWILSYWWHSLPLVPIAFATTDVMALMLFIGIFYLADQIADFRPLYLRNERRKLREGIRG